MIGQLIKLLGFENFSYNGQMRHFFSDFHNFLFT